jgi:membrane protein required for colicin V production
MNPLDWLLAILLAYSVIRAAIRGFFQEAFALGGLVLGFLFACWFYPSLAVELKGLIASPPVAQLAAFLLILLVTMVVAGLIGRLLHRTASAIGLGLVDRLLGALFGFLRGLLLGVGLLLAVTAFLPAAPWIENSRLAPYFLRTAHAVSFVMPSELQRRLSDGIRRIETRPRHWISDPLSHLPASSPKEAPTSET